MKRGIFLKRVTVLALSVAVLVFIARLSEPWIYIAEIPFVGNDNPEAQNAIAEHLATLGDKSVVPILSYISGNAPWTRQSIFLVDALSKIGPLAHKDLKTRIAKETIPDIRTRYLYCLQKGFGDFSQIKLWPGLAVKKPLLSVWLEDSIRNNKIHPYPHMPLMTNHDGTLRVYTETR
jgi:hypothetical protein